MIQSKSKFIKKLRYYYYLYWVESKTKVKLFKVWIPFFFKFIIINILEVSIFSLFIWGTLLLFNIIDASFISYLETICFYFILEELRDHYKRKKIQKRLQNVKDLKKAFEESNNGENK